MQSLLGLFRTSQAFLSSFRLQSYKKTQNSEIGVYKKINLCRKQRPLREGSPYTVDDMMQVTETAFYPVLDAHKRHFFVGTDSSFKTLSVTFSVKTKVGPSRVIVAAHLQNGGRSSLDFNANCKLVLTKNAEKMLNFKCCKHCYNNRKICLFEILQKFPHKLNPASVTSWPLCLCC